ncbi:NADase-type glycan-binding domain-containing protein [Treponema zioleckii]|uniref:NADase-type glycan-binding domain-containing protein n=1 Tax=Treponema zioleckii TaxID=331680 RepID=UPI00168AA97E|nr:hypothetical protein [Treponema zioleckii]
MKKRLFGLLVTLIASLAYSQSDFSVKDFENAIVEVVGFKKTKLNKNFIWKKGRSSALTEKGTPAGKYEINNLHDGESSTAWVEGKTDDGIGEWVIIPVENWEENLNYVYEYSYNNIKKFNVVLDVWNGYQETLDLYKKNNRVKDAEITIYAVPYCTSMEGESELEGAPEIVLQKDVQFSDEIVENPIYINWSCHEFSFELPEEYKTKYYEYEFYVRCKIKSVYKGTKYSDTCISELKAKLVKEL